MLDYKNIKLGNWVKEPHDNSYSKYELTDEEYPPDNFPFVNIDITNTHIKNFKVYFSNFNLHMLFVKTINYQNINLNDDDYVIFLKNKVDAFINKIPKLLLFI
jgi:hypothetical protein